jgi:hypothetical protein
MTKAIYIGILISLFTLNNASADSPLTSTDFYKAYEKLSIIELASTSKGLLNEKLISYLADKNNPIDVKTALINRLGWNIKGKSNATVFIKFLKAKYKYKNEEALKNGLSASDLISIAYLKAMDDYFDVKEALVYATLALARNPKGYTINIIQSLIASQAFVMKNYCQVFKMVDKVRANQNLTIDFKKEASEIIFQYIDGYKNYCKN